MIKATDHIRCTQKGFYCQHCQMNRLVAYPISLSDYVTQAKEFTKRHKHCKHGGAANHLPGAG